MCGLKAYNEQTMWPFFQKRIVLNLYKTTDYYFIILILGLDYEMIMIKTQTTAGCTRYIHSINLRHKETLFIELSDFIAERRA